jgi:hypothetical protein
MEPVAVMETAQPDICLIRAQNPAMVSTATFDFVMNLCMTVNEMKVELTKLPHQQFAK